MTSVVRPSKKYRVKGSNSLHLFVMPRIGQQRRGKEVRNLVLAALAALSIGTAAFAHPAEARCWWNGYSRVCGNPHSEWWYRHHHWGPRYGHHYWGPRYGYGSSHGLRWHSGWGY